jgi:hypothetical protein
VARGVWVFVFLAEAAGCEVGDVFVCDVSSQCVLSGVAGVCEADRHCSFPDGSCASGRRYGTFAGDRADQCVATTSDTDSGDPARDLSIADGVPGDLAADLSLPADMIPVQNDLAQCAIVFKDAKSAALPDSGVMSITINRPTSVDGDFLLAGMHLGWIDNGSQPTYTPPAGWTLVRRVDLGDDGSLLTFYRFAGAAEPASYTWQSSDKVSGVGWIVSYSGVSKTAPIDVEAGSTSNNNGPLFTTATVTTTGSNRLAVGQFGSWTSGSSTNWTDQAGFTARVAINNANNRSGMIEELLVPTASSGNAVGRVDIPQGFAIMHLLALRPCP